MRGPTPWAFGWLMACWASLLEQEVAHSGSPATSRGGFAACSRPRADLKRQRRLEWPAVGPRGRRCAVPLRARDAWSTAWTLLGPSRVEPLTKLDAPALLQRWAPSA
ncbi:MAG: hypothetical protein J3K34DRAFT_431010 [Monoraphidium minutum]|nr:MAG: hypothetical protein J3K34DRAFT_431010 [Monoraphidium minutum]